MKKIYLFFFLSFLIFFSTLPVGDILAEPKRVFIIQSYEKGHVTASPQEEGIMNVLKNSGLDVVVKVFYMETKTKYITPSAIRQRGMLAIRLIKNFKPCVVVVIDDNACREVMFRLVDSPYKFVFTGMNMPPEEYNKKIRFMESRERPGHNITGVYERLYLIPSINFIRQVLPKYKKVFAFVSTSFTGKAIRESILYELQKENFTLPIKIYSIESLKQYKKLLNSINSSYSKDEAIILPLVDRLKTAKKVLTAREMVKITASYNKLLEVGSSLGLVSLGLFGGAGVDFKEMGIQAGKKVLEILREISPANIPVEDTKGYNIILNLQRAKESGIKLPFELLLSSGVIIGGNYF